MRPYTKSSKIECVSKKKNMQVMEKVRRDKFDIKTAVEVETFTGFCFPDISTLVSPKKQGGYCYSTIVSEYKILLLGCIRGGRRCFSYTSSALCPLARPLGWKGAIGKPRKRGVWNIAFV